MSYFFLILFALLVQFFLWVVHWGLYKILVRFLEISNPPVLLVLKIILGILSLAVVSSSILAGHFDNLAVRVFYDIAFFWLGLLLYLFLAAGILWLVNKSRTFCSQRSFRLSRCSPKVITQPTVPLSGMGSLKKVRDKAAVSFPFSLNAKLLAQILLSLAVLVSVYGVFNANYLRVTRLKINLPNLPAFWQGKTAVLVTDVHLGPVRGYDFSQKVAAQIQQLSPDIIFIGGDLFDGEDGDLNKLIEPFSKLRASQGVYFVTGNHEEFTVSSKYVDAVKQAGIRVLNNEMVNLQSLQLIGVDYNDTDMGKKENYVKILQQLGLDREKPSILLKHSSFWPQIASDAGISLQLSGHVHNGQIFPVGLISYLIFQGFDYGLKHLNNLTVYTSSGVGTWGPPMRVGTISEIVLMQF